MGAFLKKERYQMKVIKIDLPRELSSVELHIFADEHLGDEHCDIKWLLQRIEYVKNTPNAYCILNGDIIDNATKTSIGDTYTQKLSPMEQLQSAVEIFEPLAKEGKILCITHGNHENRTYKKEGINLSALIAAQLGLSERYTPTSACLFIRFGEEKRGHKESNGSGRVRKICYSIYVLHGSGGGKTDGSKVNKLAKMASIIDCDIYIHSHTHLPVTLKKAYHRIDLRNSTVAKVDKLFVNTAANLDYGGYGEEQEYEPASKSYPRIHLDGKKKFFEGRV
jgi:predicted phosphodiesterase